MKNFISEVLILYISLTIAWCKENPADFNTSYNVGPYKHIYPPPDLSVDQHSCIPDPASNRTCPLYVALFMSFQGSFISSGAIPGIQVALDQINNDSRILPGYTLHYTLMDSKVRVKTFQHVHKVDST